MIFAYHRSLGPIVGMVLALALIETIVLHVIAVAYWGWKVAVVLGLLDLSLVSALVRLLISFKRRPISLVDGVLTMRTGHRMSLSIPVTSIRGFRAHWDAAALKSRPMLNMALATWPNMIIDLDEPISRRGRDILSVAHAVDDPAAFRIAILAAIGGDPA